MVSRSRAAPPSGPSRFIISALSPTQQRRLTVLGP
jgi:hypothetical protein